MHICDILQSCEDMVEILTMLDLSEEGKPEPSLQLVPVLCLVSLLTYLCSESYGVFITDESLRQFWTHAVTHFEWGASHPGRYSHIPVGVYGDEARYTNSTGYVEKVVTLVVNLPLWCPRTTRSSRFIVFTIRESLMVGYKETLWPIFEHLSQQLNHLFHEGIEVKSYGGQSQSRRLKFALTEIRGDLSWHCDALQLVPRWSSIRCCFKCPATSRQGQFQYTDYTDHAAWVQHQYTHVQFVATMLKPGPICRLTQSRQQVPKLQRFQFSAHLIDGICLILHPSKVRCLEWWGCTAPWFDFAGLTISIWGSFTGVTARHCCQAQQYIQVVALPIANAEKNDTHAYLYQLYWGLICTIVATSEILLAQLSMKQLRTHGEVFSTGKKREKSVVLNHNSELQALLVETIFLSGCMFKATCFWGVPIPSRLQASSLHQVTSGHDALWNLKAYNGRVVAAWLANCALDLARMQPTPENSIRAACLPTS